ncbi:hypothetical protein DL95DRAFT_392352 [Leptodontidium sp. 2 PMI_412]|nr:hypothetical protein DL95DRAFT_392352 [Leptodontidium sp. 2 PMI_412]
MDKEESETYLTSLLNKTLRVTTTDTRMFLGHFKCTDSDRNIILSQAYEYRLPPPPKPSPSPSPSSSAYSTNTTGPVVLDMTSRFLGLVVVPGEYITRIEVEEFESQIKGKGMVGKMVGEGLKKEKEKEKEKEAFCAGGVCGEDS